MAYKTVANTKDSISGLLSGLNLNNVVNVNTSLERTARELTQLIAVPEAVNRNAITLYDGVTDYIAPTTATGSEFIDLRPQGNSRLLSDFAYHNQLMDFDRKKNLIQTGVNVSFEYVNGVGRLRITSTKPIPKIELDAMTETTGWVAAGSASALAADTTVFWQDPASLRFTLTGSSSGTLTKTITSQDLTDYKRVGVVFLAFRTPNASLLTSISIRLGSSASNYFQVTNTTGFLGAWTANEWLLVALDLSTATTVGTPVITLINYVQLTFAHTGTLTNFYVGDLWTSLPSPHDLLQATDAIFQAGSANPLQTITSNNDTVLLNDDALLIYEYLSAVNIAQQQGGTLASGTIAELNSKLNGARARNGRIVQLGLLDLYRARNPLQQVPMVKNYYDD